MKTRLACGAVLVAWALATPCRAAPARSPVSELLVGTGPSEAQWAATTTDLEPAVRTRRACDLLAALAARERYVDAVAPSLACLGGMVRAADAGAPTPALAIAFNDAADTVFGTLSARIDQLSAVYRAPHGMGLHQMKKVATALEQELRKLIAAATMELEAVQELARRKGAAPEAVLAAARIAVLAGDCEDAAGLESVPPAGLGPALAVATAMCRLPIDPPCGKPPVLPAGATSDPIGLAMVLDLGANALARADLACTLSGRPPVGDTSRFPGLKHRDDVSKPPWKDPIEVAGRLAAGMPRCADFPPFTAAAKAIADPGPGIDPEPWIQVLSAAAAVSSLTGDLAERIERLDEAQAALVSAGNKAAAYSRMGALFAAAGAETAAAGTSDIIRFLVDLDSDAWTGVAEGVLGDAAARIGRQIGCPAAGAANLDGDLCKLLDELKAKLPRELIASAVAWSRNPEPDSFAREVLRLVGVIVGAARPYLVRPGLPVRVKALEDALWQARGIGSLLARLKTASERPKAQAMMGAIRAAVEWAGDEAARGVFVVQVDGVDTAMVRGLIAARTGDSATVAAARDDAVKRLEATMKIAPSDEVIRVATTVAVLHRLAGAPPAGDRTPAIVAAALDRVLSERVPGRPARRAANLCAHVAALGGAASIAKMALTCRDLDPADVGALYVASAAEAQDGRFGDAVNRFMEAIELLRLMGSDSPAQAYAMIAMCRRGLVLAKAANVERLARYLEDGLKKIDAMLAPAQPGSKPDAKPDNASSLVTRALDDIEKAIPPEAAATLKATRTARLFQRLADAGSATNSDLLAGATRVARASEMGFELGVTAEPDPGGIIVHLGISGVDTIVPVEPGWL